MIDVIIPAYNANDTIVKTLASIAIQSYKNKLKIYIIDDCSEKDYDEEIKPFENTLNIEILKTETNSGPGFARQYGLDHSNSEYIIFIDADDLLMSPYAIEILYETMILNKKDIVIAKEYIEEFDIEAKPLGSLHSQIFKRSHIQKENIRFTNTKYSEDNSFEQIYICTSDNYMYINNILYYYSNNKSSLTKNTKAKQKQIYEGFQYNMLYAIKECEKRKVKTSYINELITFTIVYLYITKNIKINYNKELYNYYKKYKITDEYLLEILNRETPFNNIYNNIILKDIKEFIKYIKEGAL